MRAYVQVAKEYGYLNFNIHYELFTPPKQGPMHAFTDQLHKRNHHVHEGVCLLDALIDHNIYAPYSCKIGGCRNSQVDVIKGKMRNVSARFIERRHRQKNRLSQIL